MNRSNILVLIAILVFGIILIISNLKRAKIEASIKKHLKIVPATVIKTENSGYRSGSLTVYVRYEFNGQSFKADFVKSKAKCSIISRTLPLLIDSLDNSNSYLLCSPKDFQKFRLDFPDSLSWTKDCFEL